MRMFITDCIRDYVHSYPGERNTLSRWGEPLVAYAAARDKLFAELSPAVSPTHALPTDFLASARTVVSYFIPFDPSIIHSNIAGRYSSRAWAMAYLETQQLIKDLNVHLQSVIERQGYETVLVPPTLNYNQEKHVCDWSQRHVAFIAGLGTFGLNNMLITAKGCGGRIGSLITSMEVPATPRPADERCLYKARGGCSQCIKRCPGTALTDSGYDRFACYAYCLESAGQYPELGNHDFCGKCLTNVPCSLTDPSYSSGKAETK